jgi:hypothetical protein
MRTLRVAMREPAGAARSANTEAAPLFAGDAGFSGPGAGFPGAGVPVTAELPDDGSTRFVSWQAVSAAQATNESIARLFC